MRRSKNTLKTEVRIFGSAGLIWLAIGLMICLGHEEISEVRRSQAWFVALAALSIVDFFVLRMLIQAVLRNFTASSDQKREFSRPIALWGIFKAVCLGLFLIVLLKGQKIPLLGLSLGVGTLGAVPLLGGVLWSYCELKRAVRNA